MFRKIFNRKRECPECGFQGSSREFKRAGSSNRKKNMKHTHEINADEGTEGSSGTSSSSGTSGDSQEQTKTPEATPEVDSGNVGEGNVGEGNVGEGNVGVA